MSGAIPPFPIYLLGVKKDNLNFTYSILTPWCGILLEKLTGLQLVKKFPVFYGT